MELHVRKRASGVHIVDVSGEIDLQGGYKLTELVKRMIERGVSRYVINLEKVAYIDSNGIDVLLSVHSLVKQREFAVCFANIHGSAKKVVELMKLDEYFPFVASIDDALRRVELRSSSGRRPSP